MNDSTLYTLTYLLAQALGVYAVYKLINAFFSDKKTEKKIEVISFVGYYALTSSVYLVLNIPLINFIVNIIAIFSLTFLYSSTLKKKLLVGLLTYIFMICTEMMVVTLTGYIHFPIIERNNYDSVFGIVAVNVLIFAVSMIVNGFTNIKKGNSFPKAYWFSLLIIPLSSLVILAIIFQSRGLNSIFISISIGVVLLINFTVFFLYDSLARLYQEKQAKDFIEQQNIYYENQLQLIKTSIEATNILRHDMNNHLSAVFSDVTNGNIQETQKHLIDIIDGYKKGEDFICTGYSAIDSLINFKLQFAKNNGIKVNVTASIPSNLKITSFDSTVIIGNLLDNAVRAASSVSENGFISVVMRYSKGMLLIKISNSYIGAIKRENGYLITTKSDKANHGYGLKSVKEVVEKYNGSLEIETGENTFTTTAVMYID